MAWESRWNKRYYYRYRRIGKRVVKVYMGRGEQALAASREDDERRLGLAARRYAADVEKVLAEPARELMADLDGKVRIAIQTALTAAGYRQHARGKWRKMRATTPKREQETGST